MDWQTVWLVAISLYLARRWYIRHYDAIHGKQEPRTLVEPILGTRDWRFVTIYITPPRWSGIKGTLLARAKEKPAEQQP